MDAATESLDRLMFAKFLVEITYESLLPHEFPVMLTDGSEQLVFVEYIWKSDICHDCKSFGHLIENFSLVGSRNTDESIKTKAMKGVCYGSGVGGGNMATQPGKNNTQPYNKPVRTKVVSKKSSVDKTTTTCNNDKHATSGNQLENSVEGNVAGEAFRNSFNVLSQSVEEGEIVDNDKVNEEEEIRRISELLFEVFIPFSTTSTVLSEKDGVKACVGNVTDEHEIFNTITTDHSGRSNLKVDGMVKNDIEQVMWSIAVNQVALKKSPTIRPGFLNKSPTKPIKESMNNELALGSSIEAEKVHNIAKKASNANPYVHIASPPGHKEPPLRPDLKEPSINSLISATHPGYITRSKKSVMGVGCLFDDD